MKHGIKRWIAAAVLLCMTAALACQGMQTPASQPVPESTPIAEEPDADTVAVLETAETPVPVTPAPTAEATAAPTEPPTQEPTPEPTSVPEPVRVTIGATGDVMAPSTILEAAKQGKNEYDFTALFAPFAELFQSVDLMCCNLEVPLAGEQAGYSGKKDAKTGLYSFNAPDSLLETLKAFGVDMLTTANNHCMDKGSAGMFRTIEQIRAAGLYQTGTYLDAADRENNPCVVEINGIRIGFAASTRVMNRVKMDLNEQEEREDIGYLTAKNSSEKISEEVKADIARVKNAGAEFVIVFAHWDYENDGPTGAATKVLARQLFEAGADCIIGSHPHRIKGAEFMTVNRSDGPYTGLVLYSLGNFSASNSFEKMVGLFAQITLEKDFVTGKVTLCDAAVIPSYVMRRSAKDARFAVIPAYSDPARITGLTQPLTASEIKDLEKARAHAVKRLGTVAGIRLLDGE